MMRFLEVFLRPCDPMENDYIRSMGEKAEREPLTSEGMLKWMNDPEKMSVALGRAMSLTSSRTTCKSLP